MSYIYSYPCLNPKPQNMKKLVFMKNPKTLICENNYRVQPLYIKPIKRRIQWCPVKPLNGKPRNTRPTYYPGNSHKTPAAAQLNEKRAVSHKLTMALVPENNNR